MARIRSVKPELFTDPHFCALSHSARVLYISMLTQADDRGRLDDAPKRLCANAFGENERVKPERLVEEMAAGDEPRILRYDVNGKPYIAIRNFRRHQRISKPQESRIPAPIISPVTMPFQGWTAEEERSRSAPVPLPGLEYPDTHSTPEVELGGGTGNVEVEGEPRSRSAKQAHGPSGPPVENGGQHPARLDGPQYDLLTKIHRAEPLWVSSLSPGGIVQLNKAHGFGAVFEAMQELHMRVADGSIGPVGNPYGYLEGMVSAPLPDSSSSSEKSRL